MIAIKKNKGMGNDMKLDKDKIRKGKFGFFILCLFFLLGIVFITKIVDAVTKTEEIEAVVVKEYKTNASVHTHTSGGWRMNIEWEDLNGTVQTEGNIVNKDRLEVGDTYTILVDAKTQSRRVLSKAGSIMMFGIGVCFCLGSFALTKILYGRKYYD